MLLVLELAGWRYEQGKRLLRDPIHAGQRKKIKQLLGGSLSLSLFSFILNTGITITAAAANATTTILTPRHHHTTPPPSPTPTPLAPTPTNWNAGMMFLLSLSGGIEDFITSVLFKYYGPSHPLTLAAL